MKNRAAYMVGLNKMEIRETPVPEPKAGEVLVKIEYVGICGSDVHYFKDGRCGDFVVDGELMLGHEAGGVVEKLGEGVTDLKVGDKVALEPGITCGHCEFCKYGRYNLCPDVVFLATPPVQGCNEDYITFPADMCFKLPEGMSTKEGALIEPFAVGLHAAHQGKVGMGDQCIILGSGCIGLMTLLACKACGATDITVVDMAQKRLDYAMKLGATRVINAKEKDVLKEVEAFTNGVGIEKVFETAGSPVTIAQTPYLVKKGGTITLVGMAADPEVKFNFGQIMAKEARIESVFRYRNLYAKAISAVANGIDIGMVATHEFDFEHIQEAYEAAINDKENVVKAVIKL